MTTDENYRKGITLIVLAWAIVPINDVCAKILGNLDYPLLMVVWARSFVSFLVLLPSVAISDQKVFVLPPRLCLQLLRAILLVLATLGFFKGLQTLPLAETLAIYFIYPFFITVFSTLVLGEMPGIRRWIAVIIGFCGSLLVIRPTWSGLPPGSSYVIAAALAFAGYHLLTRRISAEVGHWQVLVFQTLVGTLVTSPALIFFWQTPDIFSLSLFFWMGVTATIGHYFVIRAYQYAQASVLAPYSYFEIVSATILGFAVFGDFPDAVTWIGVITIILSGIYIGFRENIVERNRTTAVR